MIENLILSLQFLLWPLCLGIVGLILLQGGAGDLSSAFGGGGVLDSTLGVGASKKMAKVTGWMAAFFFASVLFLAIPHKGGVGKAEPTGSSTPPASIPANGIPADSIPAPGTAPTAAKDSTPTPVTATSVPLLTPAASAPVVEQVKAVSKEAAAVTAQSAVESAAQATAAQATAAQETAAQETTVQPAPAVSQVPVTPAVEVPKPAEPVVPAAKSAQ